MGQDLVAIGFAVVLIGFILIIAGALLSGGAKNTKVAVGGFIGPIPFGFANDPKMLKVIMIITITFFALFLIVPLITRYFK
ncbi:TPA: DUF131 domain-containing protein [archaeon]|uniref:DUF131 domain-containing protein n=1 Tax=Candidatus Naiadarchaeum limnaeum TaxID=2756139 RepID=A0A832V1B1_9ARCH|nr:DUF131 domain-containing protein [Candidatus Naiadarchaeales archaeon SRR2090153.bin1042]HIK00358.1 DUF131 domain-containing protein [Candidatus Naiadarchaeum limnaeum]